MNPSTTGTVVHLQGVRRERRLELYRGRVQERARAHRAALQALHDSEQLYVPPGTRLGRARLKALEWLARAGGVLELLSGEGVIPAPRLPENIDALYRQVDRQLTRAERLVGRHTAEASVARLPGH